VHHIILLFLDFTVLNIPVKDCMMYNPTFLDFLSFNMFMKLTPPSQSQELTIRRTPAPIIKQGADCRIVPSRDD
jgi:hypothetical protein